MEDISESCLSAAVCLSPNVVSGLVGVGLRRAWVRSVSVCVSASCEDSLDKVSAAGENTYYLRLFILLYWGCRTVGSGNVAFLA